MSSSPPKTFRSMISNADESTTQLQTDDRNRKFSFEDSPFSTLSQHQVLSIQSPELQPSINRHKGVQNVSITHLKSEKREICEDPNHDISGFEFNLKVFLEYILYHFLYFVLGPCVVLIAPFTGYTVLYNQRFLGASRITLLQFCMCGPFTAFLALFYLLKDPGVYVVEVYMGLSIMFIRIISIASKYAHSSETFLRLMKKKPLSDRDVRSQLILKDWITQPDQTIEEELQSTILRLELDISLFYISFLGEPPKEYENALLNSRGLGQQCKLNVINPQRVAVGYQGAEKSRKIVPRAIGVQSNSDSSRHEDTKTIAGSIVKCLNSGDWVSESITGEIKRRFTQRFLCKRIGLEDHMYNGYNMAFYLLQEARKLRKSHLGKLSFVISIVHALLPFFYRLWMKQPFLSNTPAIAILLLIFNTLFFAMNTRIIVNTIQDLEMKVYVLREVGDFISPKRISHYSNRYKSYACFNFFDPVTLRAWANLRRILLRYGDKFLQRNGVNVSLAMIFYCFVLVVLLLQVFGITPALKDTGVYLIVFSYEAIVHLVILLALIYHGAFLNEQFKVHQNFLVEAKTIIGDIMRLSYLYLGENSIEPEGYFYREGLKLLKAELGEDDFKEKLEIRAEKLMGMIDDMIEVLGFEEKNNPFKVLGIRVSYDILKSMLVGILSLGFALVQKFLAV